MSVDEIQTGARLTQRVTGGMSPAEMRGEAMKCTCGHPNDYNYAIDNGLCNSCIEEQLEELQADLDAANKDNERLLAAVGLALVLSDVESIKEVLQPWAKPIGGDLASDYDPR